MKKGFTLIELLVVISVIALLSSVVLASLSDARMKVRDARRISDMNQIKYALEHYFDAYGMYPKTRSYNYNSNGYDQSYSVNDWNSLQSKLRPYIYPLPKDPINSNCPPWTAKCYSYAYGNIGNGVAELSNTTGMHNYDLFAQLETPNHTLSCGQQPNGYKVLFGTVSLCGANPKQMYDGTPSY